VIRHETTCAVSVSRKIEPGPSPERRSKGGAKVAARRSELPVRRWPSGRWTAEGEGRRVIRHETTCAVSVSRKIEPGPSPERHSKGGAREAACRLELLVRRWSSGHWTVKGEGRRVIRHETTCAVSASWKNEPGPSPERCSEGGAKVAARRSELLVRRRSSDRWTAEGNVRRVIRHGTTCAEPRRRGSSRVRRRNAAQKVVGRRQLRG
jgi:hypothetical protein